MSSPIAKCLERHMAARAANPATSLLPADRRRLTGPRAAARCAHRRSLAFGPVRQDERAPRLWPHIEARRGVGQVEPVDFRGLRGRPRSSAAHWMRSAVSELAPPLLATCVILGIGQPAAASDPARITRLAPAEIVAAPLLPTSATRNGQGILWSANYIRPLPAEPAVRRADRRSGTSFVPASESTTASFPAAVAAVNHIRSEHGLPPFRPSAQLDQAAAGHSTWMLRSGRFSHEGKGGSRVGERIRAAGYQACYGGENLARGTPSLDVTMREWLKSPGHRRVLLSSRGAEMGFAMARDANGRPHWTMVIGTRCA